MNVQVQSTKPKKKDAPPALPPVTPTAAYYGGPVCTHDGNVEVFSFFTEGGKQRIRILGGGKSHNLSFRDVDLYIDLTGTPKKSSSGFMVVTNTKSEVLLDLEKEQNIFAPSPPTISLKWPDGKLLEVHDEFWPELCQTIVRYAESLEKTDVSVLVACEGGHGRTGVALALLGLNFGALVPEPKLLEKLRDRYCEKAVETPEQFLFLEDYIADYFLPDQPEFQLDGAPAYGWQRFGYTPPASAAGTSGVGTAGLSTSGYPIGPVVQACVLGASSQLLRDDDFGPSGWHHD